MLKLVHSAEYLLSDDTYHVKDRFLSSLELCLLILKDAWRSEHGRAWICDGGRARIHDQWEWNNKHFLKVYGRRQRLGVQKPAKSARASALSSHELGEHNAKTGGLQRPPRLRQQCICTLRPRTLELGLVEQRCLSQMRLFKR